MKFIAYGLILLVIVLTATLSFSSADGFVVSPPADESKESKEATTPPDPPTRPRVPTPSASSQGTADVVSLSETGHTAMTLAQRAKLLRDIQKMVRNEMLSRRQMDTPSSEDDSCDSSASALQDQGQAFQRACPRETEESYNTQNTTHRRCPSMPDMKDYIRKDSIPCWGCSVDY